MNEILDAPDQHQPVNPRYVDYAGVVRRVGAFIVDGVIVYLISALLTYFNFLSFDRTYYLSISLSAIAVMLYRPILEGYFGATFGKMIFKLSVVDAQFAKVSYAKAFGRSIFHIAYQLIVLAFTFFVLYQFRNSSIGQTFATSIDYRNIGNLLLGAYLFLLFVDLMVMMNNARGRSLHDNIANTFVVKTRSLTNRPREVVYGDSPSKTNSTFISALKRNNIDSIDAERDASLGLSVQMRHYAYLIIGQIKTGNTKLDNHYLCIRELIASEDQAILNALHLDLFVTLSTELGNNNLFEQQMPENIKKEYFRAILNWKEA